MLNNFLVTGCTQGLGHAIALQLSQAGHHVYAVGRQKESLEKLAKTSEHITPIHADIATDNGRQTIYKLIDIKKPLSIIHNAAIAKASQFDSLNESLLREHFETNYFAPTLITQYFLPSLAHGQRVLHISSGAADLALSGLMPYCATKSALEHSSRCLNEELNQRGIYFANLRPGMLDTQMQLHLRNENELTLPGREFYLQAERNKKLINPEVAAEFVYWVMLKTENTEFSQTCWNIYDTKYHSYWLMNQLPTP